MNIKLKHFIQELSLDEGSISAERKIDLKEIANVISAHIQENHSLDITVVCTHNSRRSQLGEIWINTLAQHFDIQNIKAYSGGMEDTAFNHRMVDALRNSGFQIEEIENGPNPKYSLKDVKIDNHPMFSKAYDHSMNPQSGYMALMVCDHADENCPVVLGMKYRIPLRYKDPKEFDDTENESQAYRDKVREIGREIYFIMNRVKSLS